MNLQTESLDPRRPFVETAAEWLCRDVREEASGAKSLAHVLVVVPTAQSGRRLRLALVALGERRPDLRSSGTVLRAPDLQATAMQPW